MQRLGMLTSFQPAPFGQPSRECHLSLRQALPLVALQLLQLAMSVFDRGRLCVRCFNVLYSEHQILWDDTPNALQQL